MKQPHDNWGDDILERIPVEFRADYLKWRTRIGALDENDEVICLAGYLNIHTRLNLDTASRIERAARASLAAQKATLFFTRYLRLILRSVRRIPFHWAWFVLTFLIAMLFYIFALHLEIKEREGIERAKVDAKLDKQVEIMHWQDCYSANSQVLAKLANSGITLQLTAFTDDSFAISSTSAYDAGIKPTQEGGKTGALYFHPPNQPATLGQ